MEFGLSSSVKCRACFCLTVVPTRCSSLFLQVKFTILDRQWLPVPCVLGTFSGPRGRLVSHVVWLPREVLRSTTSRSAVASLRPIFRGRVESRGLPKRRHAKMLACFNSSKIYVYAASYVCVYVDLYV